MSPAEAATSPASGSYVVVVKKTTLDQDAWKAVVDTLREKYDASLVVYHNGISEVAMALSTWMPRYTCFVEPADSANRQFVVDVQRLTRALDDDPYTDTQWAILTGYEPADALRIAQCSEPLVINKALSGTIKVGLENFIDGYRFNEHKAGKCLRKIDGGEIAEVGCPADSTESIVKALAANDIDAFYTSGHGTERGWQIGYEFAGGFINGRQGQLFGRDAQKKILPFSTNNPKVWLPTGNCLVGHLPDSDCFATAMIHTGGVNQMFGYTVVTFFGYMGWGTDMYFSHLPGLFSLSEAFYANQQALLYELGQKFPKLQKATFEKYTQSALYQQVKKYYPGQSGDALGMFWDRDALAFYGDPAWQATIAPGKLPWTQTLAETGNGRWQLEIVANQDGTWPERPVFAFLPKRVEAVEVTAGQEYRPEITDNFVLVPLAGDYKKDSKVTITFTGKQAKAKTTSRAAAAVMVGTPNAAKFEKAIAAMPEKFQPALKQALDLAGSNAAELAKVLESVNGKQAEGASFLIANMPKRDLQTLSSEFLLEDIQLAYEVKAKDQWKNIPDDIFLNNVLPYANLDEVRVAWRKTLMEKCLPVVADCDSPSQAAQKLNKTIWSMTNVKYSTKREKANQNPMESMKSGLASCTGLSILLVDACRSVGIPARVAGIVRWPHKRGNHTWIEVWDGKWYCLGAFDGNDLDSAWFLADTAHAVKGNRLNGVFAASYQKTAMPFLCVWNPGYQGTAAVEVTERYLPKATPEDDKFMTAFRVFEPVGKQRVKAEIKVMDGGKVIATDFSRDETSDTNETAAFELTPGKEYTIEIVYNGQSQTLKHTPEKKSFHTVDVVLKKKP